MTTKPAKAKQSSSTQILLTVGPEVFLARQAITAFIKSVREVAPSVEVIELALKGPSAPMRVVEALSPSLFAGQSVVLVTDRSAKASGPSGDSANDLVDDASEVLVDFMGVLPAEVWLAIDLASTRGRKQLIDAARAAGCQEVECEKPNARTIGTFIAKEFSKHRRTATTEAIDALRQAVGDDLPALANAVEQLCGDVPAEQLTLEAVQTYHSGLAELPWFKVSEAVWSGSPQNVMNIVRQAFARDTTAALPMIAALASDIRLMVRVAGLPRGMSDVEAGKQLGAHPYRVKVAKQQLPRWSPTVLADAILSLAELDSLVKGGLAGAGLDASARQHLVESAFVQIAAGRG